jgi:NTE family protein
MLGNWNLDLSPWAAVTDMMQRMFSPYQTNPLNLNPLRDLIQSLFDMDAIRACDSIKFFVSATDVETGRVRVFQRKEMSIDALLASACLPFTFHAVTIDGVPYWDGGYVGNPSIFPLIYNCQSPDVAIVQLNPLKRPGTPETPADIINRLNEITFNASLISEMRAIAFVERLIEEDHLKSAEAARLKRMNMHVIGAEEEMRALGSVSKSNTQMDFLLKLKDMGSRAADGWLKANRDAIGVHSSVDIHKMFL